MSAALSVTLPAALLLGLSPALREWAQHLIAEPATRYVLVFPVLLGLAVRWTPRGGESLAAGVPWILAAILAELVAFGAGLARYGRVALPLGIVGGLRAARGVPTPVAALAFFIVPVPRFVAQLGPLDPQHLWAAFSEALVPGSAEALGFDYWDSGVRLAALLAGLGWFAGLRAGDGGRALVLRAGRFLLAAPAVQALGVAFAAGCCALGAAALGRLWLLHGLWLATTAATLVLVLRRPAARAEAARV